MLERYLKVKGLAETLGEGKEMRHRLLGAEGELQHAGRDIPPGGGDRPSHPGSAEDWPLLRAAQAAEGARRQQALALHQGLFLRQIDHANRGAERVAARYLDRAKQMDQRFGEDDRRRDYIDHVRAQYPRHRALRDELNKAGLSQRTRHVLPIHSLLLSTGVDS